MTVEILAYVATLSSCQLGAAETVGVVVYICRCSVMIPTVQDLAYSGNFYCVYDAQYRRTEKGPSRDRQCGWCGG